MEKNEKIKFSVKLGNDGKIQSVGGVFKKKDIHKHFKELKRLISGDDGGMDK